MTIAIGCEAAERGTAVSAASRRAARTACGAIAILACAGVEAQLVAGSNLLDLSIEELGQIRITTASRRPEPVNRTPAAVHVITAEEIRRSGVTSIPEALRLAPGVEVARNGTSSWTISMRGFSSDLSNKLLVLIDGRSVYSPLFAGVFWDVQDVLLEDVERIEVIAGPGGTLWGSNAVNGVVNIITEAAREVQGGYAELGGGNEEEAFAAFRYGGRLAENVHGRAYVKAFERDTAEPVSGASQVDGWSMSQGGFRVSWDATPDDAISVRGDVYSGEAGAMLRGDFTLGTLPPPDRPGHVDVSGHNLLARWRRRTAGDAEWRVQLYYDHTERDIPGSWFEDRDTFDLDFQHDVHTLGRHDLIWGVVLRSTRDDIGNTTFAAFEPASRSDQTMGAFLQDRIALSDELFLTLGAKFEHNDYTGSENQPNVRLAWHPSERTTWWAAVSRAVRIPARLNEDLVLTAPVAVPGLPLPLFVNVFGNDDFQSEKLTARELGYRVQASERLFFDVTLFEHAYDRLFSQEPVGPPTEVQGPPAYILIQAVQGNLLEGETYGGTLVGTWQPLGRLRFQLQYSRLEMDLRLKPGGADQGQLDVGGNSPDHQLGLYTTLVLPRDLSLYAAMRYIDELPNQDVPSYEAVDVSLGWQPTERLRASLTVHNLNDERHLEFGEGHYIERSAYLKASWSF